MSNITAVPKNIPPTTTMASGRCTWLPIPCAIEAGNNPRAATNPHQHRTELVLDGSRTTSSLSAPPR